MPDEPMLPTASDATGFDPARPGEVPAESALPPGIVAAANCRGLTLSEWWRTCRRGDLMALCLPEGPVESAARSKLARLVDRVVRLVDPDRAWRLSAPRERVARFHLRAAREAAEAVPKAAERSSEQAAAAICATAEAYVAIDGRRTADWLLARSADIIRGIYPDVGAVLAERQADFAARPPTAGMP